MSDNGDNDPGTRSLAAIRVDKRELWHRFEPFLAAYRGERDRLREEFREAEREIFGDDILAWNNQLDKVPCPECGRPSKPSFYYPRREGHVARYCPNTRCKLRRGGRIFQVPVD